MKRSIFAIAVAGALTLSAAHAETVLYGSIRFDYSSEKQYTTVTQTGAWGQTYTRTKSKRVSNMNDIGSRLGLKGGETIGNGVEVIYQLEWGFDGMEGLGKGGGFSNRLAYIGLAGDFGLFAIGRLDNPFKVALVDGSVADEFNVVAPSSAMSAVVEAFGFDGRSNSGILDRLGNVIAYVSPDWSGFQFTAAIIMDNDLAAGHANYSGWGPEYSTTYDRYTWNTATGWTQNGQVNSANGLQALWANYNSLGLTHKKHLDAWTISAQYIHETGLYGKVAYIQGNTRSEDKSKAWGVHVGYTSDQFAITGAYAGGDYKANQSSGGYNSTTNTWTSPTASSWKSDTRGFDIGGRYSFGPNYDSSVRLNYGEYQVKDDYTSVNHIGIYSLDTNMKRKHKTWAVGFEQKLSTRTRVWAEYANTKPTVSSGNMLVPVNEVYVPVSKAKPKSEDRFSLGIRHDF